MINKIIVRLIIFLCHLEYKKHKEFKEDFIYIKGTGKQYPRYLLYTEKENVYKRMDDF
jgi:hypothetical protein